MYLSPGLAGSRSGGLIAATWAAMVTTGRSGYLAAAKGILETAATMLNVLDFGRQLATRQDIDVLGPVGVAARTAAVPQANASSESVWLAKCAAARWA